MTRADVKVLQSPPRARQAAGARRIAAGPLALGVAGLVLVAIQPGPSCDPLHFAGLLVAAAALAVLPVRLASQALPISPLPLVLIASWPLCGAWAAAGLALGALLVARLARVPSRLSGAWQAGASLVGVGLGALLGSFLVALLPEGLPAEIAGVSGFALGLWLGQTLGELLATDRAAARQSWSVTFLTYAVLVPPGYFLAQIGAAADSVLFGASLALAVGLLVLIRVTTNSQARTRELEAEVTESVSAREHLELIFDQAPEAIVGVDLAGSVSWMNRTAAAWLGWDEPTVGQPIELALPIQAADGGQLDHALLLARAAADRHPVHAEGRLEGDPDAPHQVLVSYSAMEDGDGGSQGLVLLRDLADMPETVREQEELAVKLSHELRTPLTSILGYAELITTQTRKNPSTAPRTEYVQRISDSGTYMLRLVNNLLDLGRLAREDERLPISRVELVELTRAVVEAHRPQAAARNQQLDLQAPRPPLNTRTNDLALRQILTNLVANAVKYTPPDGSIKVVLSAEPGWIVWQVVDSGIGLSEEEQQKLFTRFFRSERPEARQTRGTGLGLALSKELLERLEGSIEVQSTVDQGSTFTVRVPRR